MRAILRLAALSTILAAVYPGGALAAEETLTFKSGPITIAPYFTAQGQIVAPSPRVDGYVTAVDVKILDAGGQELSYRQVMLHHVVLVNASRPDTTCQRFTTYQGQQLPFAPERFFAVGEEGFALSLPAGYGYANRGTDIWGMAYMLMNHLTRPQAVSVQYTIRYVTGEQLTPVRPVWLDVGNCSADPVWDVPGTGGKRSTFTRSHDVTVPVSGRIVAAGAHLHGGGQSLEVSNTTCGRTIFTSLPTWNRVEPTPLLHEGGPSHMSAFRSPLGVSVSAGDVLKLTARYENSRPHTRVMGIMLLYVAPGLTTACAAPSALEVDLGSPSAPPLYPWALATLPKGPTKRTTTTWVGDYRFGTGRIALKKGERFTWNFVGAQPHNITLANGPVGFSSPNVLKGSWSYRFTRPGSYQLVCALHPVAMTQIVDVK